MRKGPCRVAAEPEQVAYIVHPHPLASTPVELRAEVPGPPRWAPRPAPRPPPPAPTRSPQPAPSAARSPQPMCCVFLLLPSVFLLLPDTPCRVVGPENIIGFLLYIHTERERSAAARRRACALLTCCYRLLTSCYRRNDRSWFSSPAMRLSFSRALI
jgi:hypothetical protein